MNSDISLSSSLSRMFAFAIALLLTLASGGLIYAPPVFAQTGGTAPLKESVEGDRLMRAGGAAKNKGQMAEAAGLWEQARAVYTRDLGPDHPTTLGSMGNLAASYTELGRLPEALKLNEETLTLKRSKLGADHPSTLRSMANLALIYSYLGRHAEALRLNEETVALRRSKLGVDHPETLASMVNLAISYSDLGRLPEALKLREDSLVLMRSKLGADHPSTLTSMANLANSYSDLGRLSEALKLREETLARRRSKLGADHPDTLASMNYLAGSYSDLGRYAEALKLREETLARRRSKLGADHPSTLDSMNNLAISYSDLGRFPEALKLREDSLVLMRSKLGADHPSTLTIMANLADSYSDLGRLAEALKLREETLALMRIKLGADHPNTLARMNNLAASYSGLGRHAEALKLDEETLALKRRKLGADHPDTLLSMGNLAGSYSQLGRYADALKLREETLSLRRSKLGTDHPDTLNSMSALAQSYRDLGRQAESLKLNEEILTLRHSKLGVDHPDTLTSMANLALSYIDLGRQAEALKLSEETLARRRSKLGADHPDTLVSASNLAVNYSTLGRHAEALQLNEEILARRRSKLGTDHPDTLASMNNLAYSNSALGRHAVALKLNEETVALRRSKLGVDHPSTLRSMNNLANSYRTAARRPDSLTLRRQSLDLIDRMAASLKTLTRDERSTALAQYLDYYSRLAQDLATDPADHAEALTVTERGKARSLLEELTARQAIANSGIPADAARRLGDLRSSLEYLDGKLAAAPNDDARKPLRAQRDASRAELDSLHQELLTRHPRYAALSAVKSVTLEQGRALLPANGVFVSWLFDEQITGVALALPKSGDLQVLKSTPGIQMIRRAEAFRWLHALPDADSFARAVQAIPLAAWQRDGILYLGASGKQPADGKTVPASEYMALRQQAIASHGQWLSDTLLKPLAAQIDSASQWIISPDGVLATIPWDTIPWNGKPLGEQKQLTVIQSLSVYKLLKDREAESIRERARAPGAPRPLLVMGGAVYGTGRGEQRSFQRAPQVVVNGASIAALEYQRQSAYEYMVSRRWPNLAGSLSEAEALHSLMGGRKFTGRDASETMLREVSQSGELARYRNLHFAAHGYLDTTVPSLSALVLAATGKDENNDGYITAGEWPAFNLKSDLLVMSACETGLGKVVSGEGVQGLPYALYVAGNRDTLLSLWQVSDGGTAVFMKRFWEKVKAGQNHAQALTQTKREFQRGEAGNVYAEPYYWAAFVLYGVQE